MLRNLFKNKQIADFAINRVRSMLPPISSTEKIALQSGTTSIDREIFQGNVALRKFENGPDNIFNIKKVNDLLHAYPQQFIYPTPYHENLFNDLGKNGFFSFLIPQKYGGNKVSVEELSNILTYITSANPSLGVVVMVPNSLGPSELLLNYGTENQKNHYLPMLANGDKIPCFGLTGPHNGSDATGSIDTGKVVKVDGKLKIEISINKRYITLAPVSNLIGLAFDLKDPDKLLGENKGGITVALLEKGHPGLKQDYYHKPMDTGFPNGTLSGDLLIDLDSVIGGPEEIGNGWKMLMECLAAGRGICLPATANASSKISTYYMYLYSKHRKQFKMNLIQMEAIQNKLVNMFYNTWAIQSSIYVTNKLLDQGEKPAVLSAIMKEQTTERARQVLLDGMDIHGGSAICKGSNNLIEKFYKSAPIGITVEGSNVLTKNLIIFGQGLNKSHPYIYPILDAVENDDLGKFGKNMADIINHTLMLSLDSFMYSTTTNDKLTIQTNNFACLSNYVALKGGSIKKEQSLSADMASIMSNLYLAHCMKIYEHNHNVSKVLTKLFVEKLTNENALIFNRIIDNLDYGSFLFYMKSKPIEQYSSNKLILKEIESNPKIIEKIKENIYIDPTLKKMDILDKLDKNGDPYNSLYNKIISVGMYKI
jgi:acyl-CoA dehydrogenase